VFFMEKLEKVTKGTIDKNDVQEVSFAEQFLESPVFAGVGYNAKITVTCCTYRGIPTVDDY